MFAGGTRPTVTQKGFRDRRRTFEGILADQFVGKLGEVVLRKYLKNILAIKIELDWEISTDLEQFRNDIPHAQKKVSIKSSPTLAGAWAEAPLGYDYGVCVKCSVPQATIMQFFIEACGFSRLLDFAGSRIPPDDERFSSYLQDMRERIRRYKCGEFQTTLKGIVCGYFETSDALLVPKGTKLDYLGEVREERYFAKISDLKWRSNDWEVFKSQNGL